MDIKIKEVAKFEPLTIEIKIDSWKEFTKLRDELNRNYHKGTKLSELFQVINKKWWKIRRCL